MTPIEHALTGFMLPTIYKDGEQKALEVIQSMISREGLPAEQAQVLGAMAMQLRSSPNSAAHHQLLVPDHHTWRRDPSF